MSDKEVEWMMILAFLFGCALGAWVAWSIARLTKGGDDAR